jgi:queuine tRNA-ribosyltransferase
MLAARLNTIHNLWYFSDFMRRLRTAIAEGSFSEFREAFYRGQEGEPSEALASDDRDAGTTRRTAQDI